MSDVELLPSPDTRDVWERLSEIAGREPIVIYGTGNGADKVIDALEARGIPVSGVFASDGFVRDRSFRGHKVASYADMRERYGNFTALLAFGTSRPDVMANIKRIASEVTLLCPDVPAFGELIFDSRYYREHYAEFEALAEKLTDGQSRRTLGLILRAKLTGELDPLFASSVPDPGDGILAYEKYETVIDLGAYTGDTVREAVAKMARLRRVYAFEPERRAFAKLSAYAETVDVPEIRAYNAAAWSTSGIVRFVGGSGRGSSAGASIHKGAHTAETPALAVDDIPDFVGDKVDFIKFDVEGAEAEALRGAESTIRRCQPDMLVSVYHRTDDLLALPKAVSDLCPDHRLYLRRGEGVPAWDIDLLAVK